MKCATIVPQPLLKFIKNDEYHMCLSHLLFKPEMREYTQFYQDQVRKGHYVIMDNGLIEGNPRPIEELVANAADMGVQELILPDVFCDKKATLHAIETSYTKVPKGIKRMAVPQGKDIEEWLDCATYILRHMPEIEVIGIPKVLVKIAGRDGRLNALHYLNEACPLISNHEIHLLGCWTTPLEVLMIDKAVDSRLVPKIRGVDSGIAYVYARKGIRLDSNDRPDSDPIDFQQGQVKRHIKKNIAMWRAAADSAYRKTMWNFLD